jgi:hypothetical protein
MTTPNYETMTLEELRQYILTHRADQDAFHAYIDRSKESGRMITIDPTDPSWEVSLNRRIQESS